MGEVMKGCWEIQDEVVALATTLQQDSQPRMDLPLSLCRHLDLGYQPRRASPTRFQRLPTFPSSPRLELANRALSAVTSLKFNIVQQVEKHAMLAAALSAHERSTLLMERSKQLA